MSCCCLTRLICRCWRRSIMSGWLSISGGWGWCFIRSSKTLPDTLFILSCPAVVSCFCDRQRLGKYFLLCCHTNLEWYIIGIYRVFYGCQRQVFEYDPNKSMTNFDKHGIDFDEAQNLWEDESKIVFPASVEGEERFLMVARYKSKHWTAVYTVRGGNIRIISVRRSRTKEISCYEN